MKHRTCVAGAVFLASLLLSSGTYAQLGQPRTGQKLATAVSHDHAKLHNSHSNQAAPADAKSMR